MLRTTFVDRDFLLRTHAETFFITDHYRDYAWVLVRLRTVRRAHLADLLEDAWRDVAPKRLVHERVEPRPAVPAPKEPPARAR